MPEYRDWLRLMKEKAKYYPKGWETTDVFASFVQEKVAMIESVGIHMRMIRDDTQRNFEIGIAPFPLVTTAESQYADKGVIRGNAGYSTTWQISNSAVEKDTVEECIDFLMFLTTPENNSRLVNKLEATAPAVVGAEPVDMFKPMQDIAEQDMNDGFVDWHASCIFTAFDADVNDMYEDDLFLSYMLGNYTEDQFIEKGDKLIRAAIERFKTTSNWDTSKW